MTRFLSFLGHLVFPGAYGTRARGHVQWQEGTWEEEEEEDRASPDWRRSGRREMRRGQE